MWGNHREDHQNLELQEEAKSENAQLQAQMVPLEGGVESWRQAVDFRFGDFPGGSDGKASVYNVGDLGLIPGSGSSLEKEMATTPVLLPRKSHGRRGLVSMGSHRVRHD